MTENLEARPKGLRRFFRIEDEPMAHASARLGEEFSVALLREIRATSGIKFVEYVEGEVPREDSDQLLATRMELARLEDFLRQGVVPRRRDVVILGKPLLHTTIHAKA